MYSAILVSALCGLAAAAPRPQQINVAAIDDLTTPSVLGPDVSAATATSSYDPSSAASVAAAAVTTAPVTTDKRKRGVVGKRDCTLEPNGYVFSNCLQNDPNLPSVASARSLETAQCLPILTPTANLPQQQRLPVPPAITSRPSPTCKGARRRSGT